MSTNPNNAIGTNAAYDGRTSVNAFNDIMGVVSRGVLSGWACVPNSGMTVSLGGTSGVRDVAIAEDNNGNRTSINNITGLPVDITMSAAPVSNSRIDLIVAYVDNPPTGTSTVADNPAPCGIITVEGTAAATPTVPSDADIRSAITADGASGTTAYYAVLAQITISSGTTDIDGTMIASGANAGVGAQNIDFSTFDYNPSEASGYYILGNLLFCWGSATINIPMPAYSENSAQFTFAKAFNSTPAICVTNGDLSNNCGEYSVITARSKTGFSVLAGHTREATSTNMVVSYLAVGIIA